MLYQQINDLVITGHNWLWNKGHDILSISFLLLNIQSCSLQLVLPEKSTCPLFAPASYSPLPLLFSLSISLRRTFFPFIFPAKHLENRLCLHLSITFNRPDAYSVLHPPPMFPTPSHPPTYSPGSLHFSS